MGERNTTTPGLLRALVAEQRTTNLLLRRLIALVSEGATDAATTQPVAGGPDASLLKAIGGQMLFGSDDGVRTTRTNDGGTVQRYPMDDQSWLVVKISPDGDVVAMVHEDKLSQRTLVTMDQHGNIRPMSPDELDAADEAALRYAGAL